MKAIRRLAAAVAALAALAGPASIPVAHAGPLRFTVYDCGLYADCLTGPPTVLAQFVSAGRVQAPAVPPAGTFSALQSLDIDQVLAGSWDEFGILSFNTNNFIGSQFVVTNLHAANERDFGSWMGIAPVSIQGLRLVWDEGVYTGLGLVGCYTANCSTTTPIRAFSKIVVDPWVQTGNELPEPGALSLALAALALGASTMRVRKSSSCRAVA